MQKKIYVTYAHYPLYPNLTKKTHTFKIFPPPQFFTVFTKTVTACVPLSYSLLSIHCIILCWIIYIDNTQFPPRQATDNDLDKLDARPQMPYSHWTQIVSTLTSHTYSYSLLHINSE